MLVGETKRHLSVSFVLKTAKIYKLRKETVQDSTTKQETDYVDTQVGFLRDNVLPSLFFLHCHIVHHLT